MLIKELQIVGVEVQPMMMTKGELPLSGKNLVFADAAA